MKKRLEFTLPEEIAKQQQIYDYAQHLNSLKSTVTSSQSRVKSLQEQYAALNSHSEALFALRRKGYYIVPIRHDRMFEGVVLSDRVKSKDIYVIGLNYKEHHETDSVLRKALYCDSKLTFDR